MKNSQKGSAALILLIIVVLVIAGFGYYFYNSKSEVAQVSTIENNAGEDGRKPIIESVTPTLGKIGTSIEIRGDNFAGFENDIIFWIKNGKGERGVLFTGNNVVGEGTNSYVQTTIAEKLCTKVTIYSGDPCTTWMNIVPGQYEIYTDTPSGDSNSVGFTVVK